MNPKIQKMLGELGKSDYGDVLKEYLEESLKTMKGDIDNVESWEDVLARRKAKTIIKEIFYFLEVKPTQQKDKNQYV